MPPDFLVIGHVVQDLVPGGWRLGGTASYASFLAARLGLHTVVITAAAPDMALSHLPGIAVLRLPSPATTQIRNVYTDQGRVQYIPQRAASITEGALSADLRNAGIVLLGPVVGEVNQALAACFPSSILGVSAQGWLREIGPDSRVRPVPPSRWDAQPLLRHAQALFVSDEDISAQETEAALEEWSRLVPILAFTRGERGAEICHRGRWRHIDAFPVAAPDPTGAGDVFAAAFLIRLHALTLTLSLEGEGAADMVWEAARFASAAASFIVEAEGTANVPDRAMIEARLRAHPEIVCR